jgi:hypothetical protein
MAGIDALIADYAARYGLDPATMQRIAYRESKHDPYARNKTSSAGGVYQFIDKTWSQYGNGRDKFDPEANIDAGMRFTVANRDVLRKALGRDPTGGELYLAHQQGAKGAIDLLRNPRLPAEAVVGADAVRLNAGQPGVPAGAFADRWTRDFDRLPTSVAGGAGRPMGVSSGARNMAPQPQPVAAMEGAPGPVAPQPDDIGALIAAVGSDAGAQPRPVRRKPDAMPQRSLDVGRLFADLGAPLAA